MGLFVFCCVFTALFTTHDDASSHAARSKLCAAALEGWAFYLYWLLALAHAVLYPTQVWRRQLQLAAGLAVGAVLLNWLTTGDHLLRSLSAGNAAVAGMDLMLLALADVSLLAARRIRQAESAPHRTATGDTRLTRGESACLSCSLQGWHSPCAISRSPC